MRALLLLPLVSALNILLTSTDSWVSKNPRYLHAALKDAGHDVLYVGPLNDSEDQPMVEPGDNSELQKRAENCVDGDFKHLGAATQNYYKYVRKLKQLARGAKKVISKKDLQAFDESFNAAEAALVRGRTVGQDPLNADFWYVDGTALEALALAFAEVLPQHRPDFTPDLVIVGPNEGLHLSLPRADVAGITGEDLAHKSNQAEAMSQLAQLRGLPVLSVSTADLIHVYYENEQFFAVEEREYARMFKANSVAKNVQFVNERVLRLVDHVVPHMGRRMALNVNFPLTNHHSLSCFTNAAAGPDFVQVVNAAPTNLGLVVSVPAYELRDGVVAAGRLRHWKVADLLREPEEVTPLELERMQPLFSVPAVQTVSNSDDMNAVLCNVAEYRVLQLCGIAVSVGVLGAGNNLGPETLDLALYV